jgi:hypothetical protein
MSVKYRHHTPHRHNAPRGSHYNTRCAYRLCHPNALMMEAAKPTDSCDAPDCYLRRSALRDVELILAERGIVVSYEIMRRWCQKFGQRLPICRAAAVPAARQSALRIR